MSKELKDVISGMSVLILFIAYSFSWVFGFYTALSIEQEAKWMVFDIIVSMLVPFYGTVLWLVHIVFG